MLYHYTLPALALMTAPLAAQELVVVTDIAPVHSLAAQVMEGIGEPVLLVGPGDSPHHFSLRPSQARALQDADAVFWIGPELTPWMGDILDEVAQSGAAMALLDAPGAHHLSPREGPVFGEDHDDHDHGHDHDHDHGETDPHAWLDPDNAALWLAAMADQLASVAPEHAETFRKNATAAQAALRETIASVEATLAPAKDTRFVVFHDGFQYFEDHFGLTSLGAVALSDAAAPSPKRLSELREHLSEASPTCAFSEPQLNTKLLDTALEGMGVKVSELDPLGSTQTAGPDLYNSLLREMAEDIATCAD